MQQQDTRTRIQGQTNTSAADNERSRMNGQFLHVLYLTEAQSQNGAQQVDFPPDFLFDSECVSSRKETKQMLIKSPGCTNPTGTAEGKLKTLKQK